ncbi:MAG TPA: hypothetical protein VJN96_22840 [Vicinamibacterales bacterium]|nr:hypothetical protein [Vicinamibacterales bacterium]
MNEHRRRILDMLAAGKITADEADKLLQALPSEAAGSASDTPSSEGGKFFRIEVRRPARDGCREKKVDIRVPVTVVKSGLKLGSLLRGFKDDRWSGKLSDRLRAHGVDVDWDHLDMAQLETLIAQVGDVSIDVDDGRATIRVTRE